MTAGIEVWEDLMLWCSEAISSTKLDLPPADVIKGNHLVKTHMYAGFLCYNASWADAIGVYRKENMYRYALSLII